MIIGAVLKNINKNCRIGLGVVAPLRYYLTQISNQIGFTPKFYIALEEKLVNKNASSFLRLQITAGQGCEGFTYKFKFDQNLNKQKDLTKTQTFVNKDGKEEQRVIFAINGEQLKFLKGATLDYSQQMMREIFYVKQNPNAQLQCSCKVSFSPKDGIL